MFSSSKEFLDYILSSFRGRNPNPSDDTLHVHLLPRFKAGYLLIESATGKKWKKYVIVLAGSSALNLCLYYYEKPTDKEPIGRIPLVTAQIEVLDEMLMIVTHKEHFFLCAETPRLAKEWAKAICDALESFSASEKKSINVIRSRFLSAGTETTIEEIQTRTMKIRVEEFHTLFVNGSEKSLQKKASKGGLTWSCLRSIAWKIWLGYFSRDEPFSRWSDISMKSRARYSSLRNLYAVENIEEELMQCEPEESTSSPRNSEEAPNSEERLLHNICRDVHRTQSGMSFYRDIHVQKMLVRILYVWSKANPEVSYNQGMSELVAVIFFLLHVEKLPENISTGSSNDSYNTVGSGAKPFAGAGDHDKTVDISNLLRNLLSPKYIEHDAYALLDIILRKLVGTFCPILSDDEEVVASSISEMNGDVDARRNSFEESTLKAQLDRIHSVVLYRCDPPLARHLDSLHLEPETYLLRWVRLLLSREFSVVNVWKIWDVIFSITPKNFSLIDCFCVACVRYFRTQLLEAEDIPSALICLRNLGQHVSVDRLVDNALDVFVNLAVASQVELAVLKNGHI